MYCQACILLYKDRGIKVKAVIRS